MSGNMLEDSIKSDSLCKMLEFATVEDNVREKVEMVQTCAMEISKFASSEKCYGHDSWLQSN